MARASAFAAGLVCGLVLGTAVIISHADPVEAEVSAAAAEAHVDAVDLLGAVNSTGQDPYTYLRSVGELPPLRPPPQVQPLVGAVARADCIIAKESHGLDVPNAQGSGAWGPGQYMSSTWSKHVALYRAGTGYAGALSQHSLADVRRVMAWVLMAYPGSRSEWRVGGC